MKRRALLWGAGGAVLAGACWRRVRREAPPRAAAVTAPELTDFTGDGTPDFLRLEDRADRLAFTAWFTFLAEAQHYLTPQDRPREVTDCAALVRFAFREALRKHELLGDFPPWMGRAWRHSALKPADAL